MQTTTRHEGNVQITTHDYTGDFTGVNILEHHATVDHLHREVTISYRPDSAIVTISGPTPPAGYDPDNYGREHIYSDHSAAEELVARALTEQDMRDSYERAVRNVRRARTR